MQKTCLNCKNGFEITNDDLKFYTKIDTPLPTLCPTCRMIRRLLFRNERFLYKTKSSISGKEVLSHLSADKPYKVYDQSEWWSDKWDPMEYGFDFDFNKTFTEQFEKLLLAVPQINLQNKDNENSEFCQDTGHLKNCYLIFNGGQSEDCYYGNTLAHSKNCIDMFWCLFSELCYECVKSKNCYRSFYCINSHNLQDCILCSDCIGCKNCFGCVNLRHSEYWIFNKQYTKDEYEKFIKKFLGSNSGVEEAKKMAYDNYLKHPHRNLIIDNSENCLGNYIANSKNCIDCFDMIENSSDCRYIWDGCAKDGYDCFNAGGLNNTELLYECVSAYDANNIKFSVHIWNSSDIEYSYLCLFSSDLFGCTGLHQKKYCIFNKQFTKEKYFKQKQKIIEHMKKTGEYGEFFNPRLGCYGYNETAAQYWFPLEKEQALEKGYKWKDPEKKDYKPQAYKVPDNIKDVPDSIIKELLACKTCRKNYKILAQELKLYREFNLPIPLKCPDCRYIERKNLCNPRKLWDRNCEKCGASIKTVYSPERPEIVYCEACYLKEVY